MLANVGANTEVGLIVFYGCGDIQVVQPFTTDINAVAASVETIYPANDTPLADAIRFAKEYIRNNAAAKGARLVVLSDGEETCGGDPVAAAQS